MFFGAIIIRRRKELTISTSGIKYIRHGYQTVFNQKGTQMIERG